MTEHRAPAHDLTFRLDASRPAPLYQQLSDGIRRQVLASRWPVDSAMPSERQLMRLTGLSRMTVRQAIDTLTRDGLLFRIHGRGTFIVPERVDQDIRGVYSFSERIRAQGRVPSTQVISRGEVVASDDEAELLRIEPGTVLYRLVRLRCIDDEPVVVDVVRLPAILCPGLLRHDLTISLYALLTTEYNLPPLRSIDTIEAVGAPREIAEPLGVKAGTPLTLMRRVATTHGDLPIELTEEYARPDRMRYRLQLYADPLIEASPHTEGKDRQA
jgi:GntR family transcriptional regulator